ncbi:MAG: glycolate oxidase subunit GlcF [Gammaproteobacteria bacterium]|nr:glycolate oxidase subunit GlcF [Gammaproteobacteria bacterium]NIN60859.1 glycolate oxidase subunit GlcF [Gammaproteobacteria bacterium]NIO62482.1 glycolate oxidase subunit GlcF [Gammaproteobacteria bacterium]NIQ18642.1 glycolate oxidase subunit GlcF [Gammaproteobacteria bacterium]NIT04688.1 glycolate oxidase subunit GlcF [Gammaproteobacteria bacterium]
MQTFITQELKDTPQGKEADRIIRSCVHCGFCTATCPTYQLLGDELDGPRGRIYLIKSLLEGNDATEKTRLHLDRCLTCRACETICPSAVEYSRLLDIGRHEIEIKAPRSLPERFKRQLLLNIMPYRSRFALLLFCGQIIRPLLPGKLKSMIPERRKTKIVKTRLHKRRVILFRGCVQPALNANINRAAIRVLDKLGVSAIEVKNETCCGALSHHLGESAAGFMKANIDAWWPHIIDGAEAIINTASGCGVMLKDYAYLLREDPDYADKAKTILEMTRDPVEFFTERETEKLQGIIKPADIRVAFQNPCTLQHGQKLGNRTEALLSSLGLARLHVEDSILCCGSAGTYSLFQPELSAKLRQNKINNLVNENPDVILTANIGCQLHLQQATDVPVKHWIELVEELI